MSVDCCVHLFLNIVGGNGHRNVYYVSTGVGKPRETGKLDCSCLFQNESRWLECYHWSCSRVDCDCPRCKDRKTTMCLCASEESYVGREEVC